MKFSLILKLCWSIASKPGLIFFKELRVYKKHSANEVKRTWKRSTKSMCCGHKLLNHDEHQHAEHHF